MKVAVYSIVRDRPEYTAKSFRALRKWSGIEFDHYVADNGSGQATTDTLRKLKSAGHIHTLHLHDENLGQNLAANCLIDEMPLESYDWVVRWDNDALPRTRRFLRKLLRIGERCREYGVAPVLLPRISRLKHPPATQRIVDLEELQLEQVEIAGGICRAHPAPLFEEWRYSKYAPLGFGEAGEMAQLTQQLGMPILRVPHLEVEHMDGHDGQVEAMPEEHTWERREVGRYVSYGL